jgi:hypothetical protein
MDRYMKWRWMMNRFESSIGGERMIQMIDDMIDDMIDMMLR